MFNRKNLLSTAFVGTLALLSFDVVSAVESDLKVSKYTSNSMLNLMNSLPNLKKDIDQAYFKINDEKSQYYPSNKVKKILEFVHNHFNDTISSEENEKNKAILEKLSDFRVDVELLTLKRDNKYYLNVAHGFFDCIGKDFGPILSEMFSSNNRTRVRKIYSAQSLEISRLLEIVSIEALKNKKVTQNEKLKYDLDAYKNLLKIIKNELRIKEILIGRLDKMSYSEIMQIYEKSLAERKNSLQKVISSSSFNLMNDFSRFILNDINYSDGDKGIGFTSSVEISESNKNFFIASTNRYRTEIKDFSAFNGIALGINSNKDLFMAGVLSSKYMDFIRVNLGTGMAVGNNMQSIFAGGLFNINHKIKTSLEGDLIPYAKLGCNYSYLFKNKQHELLTDLGIGFAANAKEFDVKEFTFSPNARFGFTYSDILNLNNKSSFISDMEFGLKASYKGIVVNVGYKYIINYNFPSGNHAISMQINL